ncbi:YDL099W [Saccharomyces arboricola H-6]|uniref:YDL099W n=1 Tax=Saccharomyces arboricola (strain H-6 / AS 2.3317 / CBS 10644) TaxID=1160507 RepID=J8Q3V4_SACAR|nr:YDL099W [Saccharomyces arboricola H-6]
MSDQEAEAKRAKQLEEARKRVEELKKKKNKKGKGKKNKSSSIIGTVGSDTPELESTPSEGLTQEPPVTVDSAKNENNDENVEESKDNEDAEEKEVEPVEPNEGQEVKVKGSLATPVGDDGAESAPTGELEETSSRTENNEIAQTLEVEEDVKPQDVKDLLHSSEAADDLFGSDDNEESDFLTTIEKQKEEDELNKLRAEVEELTKENKQLKFLNMENETTIDDLQEQLQEREDMINSLQNDLQTTTDELTATQQRLKEAQKESARTTTATPVQFADFNASSHNNLTPSQSATKLATPMARGNHAEMDRVMLDKWRHWNVDMTSWRSIGSGPIIEF